MSGPTLEKYRRQVLPRPPCDLISHPYWRSIIHHIGPCGGGGIAMNQGLPSVWSSGASDVFNREIDRMFDEALQAYRASG